MSFNFAFSADRVQQTSDSILEITSKSVIIDEKESHVPGQFVR
jgi:hypothetical protein